MNMRSLLYALDALLFGKEPLVAIEYEVGPKIWAGYFGEKKNFLSLPGIEPQFFTCPAHSVVFVLTALLQLSSIT
jgi:hypothetical protein